MQQRHHSDLLTSIDSKQRRYELLFPNRVKNIEAHNNVENLGLYMNEALDLFAYCVVNQREKAETLKYLQQALAFGVGNFMSVTQPEGFSIVIEGQEIALKGDGNTAYKNVSMWLKAMYCAIILRDNNAIENLCQSSDSVFQGANIKANVFDLAMVQVFKGLFDPTIDLSYWITEAHKQHDSSAIEPERKAFIADISTPTLALYKCILAQDEQGFNEALEQALQLHHRFWSKSVSLADDRAGWVSLPLLAVCAFAVDHQKFTINIQSAYLPEWLYCSKN